MHGFGGSDLKEYARPSDLLGLDGGTPVSSDTYPASTSMVCVESNRNDPDIGAILNYIDRGSPSTSIASILSGQRVPEGETPSSAKQMPPIVTRAVDTAGRAKLGTWITYLTTPCP